VHSNEVPPPADTRRQKPPQLDSSVLQTLLEKAPAFITLLGPDRRLQYVNRVEHGFTQDDLIGQPFDAFLAPNQLRKYEAALDGARTTGEQQIYELWVDTPDGHRTWTYNVLSALRDPQGELSGYISISTEITAQKQTEERLKKTQADLVDASHRAGMAEVATGVLHNIGNVLNSVNVSASTLLEQVELSHTGLLERAVKLMEEQGERLPEFIASDPKGQKLPLLLSRVTEQLSTERDAMRAELQRLMEHINIIRSTIDAQQSVAKSGDVLAPVTLDELVERTLSMFRIELERTSIELERETEELPPVLLDKQGAVQILVNLVRNAVEALDGVEHPRLAVKARADGDTLVFEIEDNGCGVAAENLTRIFRHGFTTKQSGHGFGLHASAIAAQAMGGSLSVISEGSGRGARFCLTLPRRDAPAT
jgi:two-component system, LuxR family, sensor kinase FixL